MCHGWTKRIDWGYIPASPRGCLFCASERVSRCKCHTISAMDHTMVIVAAKRALAYIVKLRELRKKINIPLEVVLLAVLHGLEALLGELNLHLIAAHFGGIVGGNLQKLRTIYRYSKNKAQSPGEKLSTDTAVQRRGVDAGWYVCGQKIISRSPPGRKVLGSTRPHLGLPRLRCRFG